MTLLVAVLAPAVMVEEVESNVTGTGHRLNTGYDSRLLWLDKGPLQPPLG